MPSFGRVIVLGVGVIRVGVVVVSVLSVIAGVLCFGMVIRLLNCLGDEDERVTREKLLKTKCNKSTNWSVARVFH